VLGTPLRSPAELPEGYRLDLISDPDAPVLRRQDGAVVARFVAGGATREAVELEAFNDLATTWPRANLAERFVVRRQGEVVRRTSLSRPSENSVKAK
jgi:hypothetical protein